MYLWSLSAKIRMSVPGMFLSVNCQKESNNSDNFPSMQIHVLRIGLFILLIFDHFIYHKFWSDPLVYIFGGITAHVSSWLDTCNYYEPWADPKVVEKFLLLVSTWPDQFSAMNSDLVPFCRKLPPIVLHLIRSVKLLGTKLTGEISDRYSSPICSICLLPL